VLAIDAGRRAKITAAEALLAERNAATKETGAAKARGDEAEFERLRALVARRKDEIARLEEEAKAEDDRLSDLLLRLPNPPLPEVPDGATRTTTSSCAAAARPAPSTSRPASISTSPP
jgi:seryl-tRNA synthetase